MYIGSWHIHRFLSRLASPSIEHALREGSEPRYHTVTLVPLLSTVIDSRRMNPRTKRVGGDDLQVHPPSRGFLAPQDQRGRRAEHGRREGIPAYRSGALRPRYA